MEAMAMGVPVVATRVGGVPELIDSGRHGLLVEPRRPDLLAGELLRIAHDPALARSLSLTGRKRVEEEFDTFRSARMLLGLWRDVCPATVSLATSPR
jgi:glycosyltransferase involved in cell wall biosynthesis